MKDEKLCKKLLEILLGLHIEKIEYLNTEHLIENNYENRGIRMDVFLQDSTRVINIEMQTGDYDNLILRSRYYSSSSDVNTVSRRSKFKDLKENYILFICKDDPFGKGLPCYSKISAFKETSDIPYDDKTHNVFYNSSAYAKAENKEVQDVLEFIYKLKANSNFTKQLEDSVSLVKAKGTMKDEYMYFQDILDEEKDLAREAGLAEGLAEGKAKGLAEGLAEGENIGIKSNKIETAKRLLNEKCTIDFILKITDLSEKEIEALM